MRPASSLRILAAGVICICLLPCTKQIEPQASLGLADLMAQRRLGQVQQGGRARDAAGLGHGLQHAQVADLELEAGAWAPR